jgi:hypothetical protein
MEGFIDATTSSENQDFMTYYDELTQVAYLIVPINKEMVKNENNLFELMKILSQMKKTDNKKEDLLDIKEELNLSGENYCKEEVSETMNHKDFHPSESQIDGDDQNEMNSDCEFLNINDVKLLNDEENFGYKCINPRNIKKIDKFFCNKPLYAKDMFRICNERNSRTYKMCVSCKSKTVSKGGRFCWSCSYQRNKIKPYLCKCDKPHYARGLCRNCYARMNYSKKKK